MAQNIIVVEYNSLMNFKYSSANLYITYIESIAL